MIVLSFILLLQFSQRLSHCATITVQPESINTTLNSTVVFSCEGTGDELSFRVNNTPATDVIAKGFIVTSSVHDGTRRAELQAIAYKHNNNTEVKCRAITDEPLQSLFSDAAILMIQGLLASVVDLDYTFINGSSVLLTWTAPYTLDNVPITGYYIVVNGLGKITTINDNTNIVLSATNRDPCLLNNVSVSPINDVGIGSSNNISFYYKTVPLITPPVSVVPVIDGQLNISINVSKLCIGEYPNNVTVIILNTDNEVQDSISISTQVNDQLMITGVIGVPHNLNTFIVNVSLSNDGGEFLPTPYFGYSLLGSVTNIDSSIDNCSTIDITWTAPTVDDRVSILYYILGIYDDITGSLVDTVSVYDTSYQFVDNNLFIHRYTYVITGVNELGEGISNNNTFSYQRVPQSVTDAGSNIITFNQNTSIAFFNISVALECTGEAPENATVTIQCNGAGVIFDNRYLVEYTTQSINITGSAIVPLYEQCNISIVFSNEAGSSEPFIQLFNTTTASIISTSTATTFGSETPSPTSGTINHTNNYIIPAVLGTVSVCIVLVVVISCVVIIVNKTNEVETLRNSSEHATIQKPKADANFYQELLPLNNQNCMVATCEANHMNKPDAGSNNNPPQFSPVDHTYPQAQEESQINKASGDYGTPPVQQVSNCDDSSSSSRWFPIENSVGANNESTPLPFFDYNSNTVTFTQDEEQTICYHHDLAITPLENFDDEGFGAMMKAVIIEALMCSEKNGKKKEQALAI